MSHYRIVEGHRCRVVESLGWNPDIGRRVIIVLHDGKERKAIRTSNAQWRFWTAPDRVKALLDAIRREGKLP